MPFDNLRDDVRRWGIVKSVYVRVMRLAETCLRFRLFVVHARELNPAAPEDDLPPGCVARVMLESELIEFSRDPMLGLSADSIRRAIARGDVCFGYLERGKLVSYTWVATQPTPAEAGLWVRFGDGHSYGYKALTLPSHRGRHLLECLVHLTDRWQTSHGCRYNIDYIHTGNLPSIVADRRYGNRPIGYAGYVRGFRRVIPFRTRGAKARGFEFFVPSRAIIDTSSATRPTRRGSPRLTPKSAD